jgi:hypothetical protein
LPVISTTSPGRSVAAARPWFESCAELELLHGARDLDGAVFEIRGRERVMRDRNAVERGDEHDGCQRGAERPQCHSTETGTCKPA